MRQPHKIVDYDSNDYDYRTFWVGRDYEQRSEAAVLNRCVRRLGHAEWLIDLGAGYGRNYPHYRAVAHNVALVDYSTNNLETAAGLYTSDVVSGRVQLVRADLNALPFRDGAFDAGVTIRVLHHLPDVERTLPEMLRTLAAQALIDVPIKHHVFERLRAFARNGYPGIVQTASAAPRVLGESDYPFYAFHLDAIRRQLDRAGWDSEIAASVNNFRRWDQVLPRPVVAALNPAVRGLEVIAQRVGRDWWGPNQFLHARRRSALVPDLAAAPEAAPAAMAALAPRMCCPSCHGSLRWSPDSAGCTRCDLTFRRRGAYWDFTIQG